MTQYTALLLFICLLAGCAQQPPSDSAMPSHASIDHAAHMKAMIDPKRQAEVSARGVDVMPFSLSATVHVFAKTPVGGMQRVLARSADDTAQVTLVRQHLRGIREQFLNGDFSGPSHIHGHDMPGLAALTAAKPGQIDIVYNEVAGGAELAYRTTEAPLVSALHQWFDAQLADHGKDATDGHSNHSGAMRH
jgi:hypothetical protein